MDKKIELQTLYGIHTDAWKLLHSTIDKYSNGIKWDEFIETYKDEAQKCFKNGSNQDDGYADGYNKELADYRMVVFTDMFNYLGGMQNG